MTRSGAAEYRTWSPTCQSPSCCLSPQPGVTLWLGDGQGGFGLIQEGNFGYGGVALGDVNGDGFMDVGHVIHHNYSGVDAGDQMLEVLRGNGTGSGWVAWDNGLAANGETWGMFGTNGRQANARGNGTSFQCVVPPAKRAGLLVGAGTVGACDGTSAQDLNARWTAKPAQNHGAGAVVQAQLWYRDPFNTSNQTTRLSDALEFTIAP